MSFARKNPYKSEFQRNFINEADLLNEQNYMIRPPETVLHPRNNGNIGNWYNANRSRGSSSRSYYNRGRQMKQNRIMQQDDEKANRIDHQKEQIESEDIENHRDWQHYHSYKERRDLYEQLKAITSL